jgi:DNA-directed RNA polymerase subunit RPC12/RpoP
MPRKPGETEGRPWKAAVALVLVMAAGAAAWWLATGREGGASAPAICTQCGAEQMVKIGDAPGQEEWPRECPRCRSKHLYMARKCEKCGKPIPFKDPQAEKFGLPGQCPFCKRPVVRD